MDLNPALRNTSYTDNVTAATQPDGVMTRPGIVP